MTSNRELNTITSAAATRQFLRTPCYERKLRMSRITPEEVRELALLARLALSEQEISRMTGDLDAILDYVDAMRELDTAGVEPMTHAVPFDCPLRPDQVAPSLPVDEALRNAPRREASFFQVPRIVPGPGGGGGEEDL
jgi:aspartyl-tRNA(Asn)/glutamyl-tRNA(Gln) amidotransferase subunit C